MSIPDFMRNQIGKSRDFSRLDKTARDMPGAAVGAGLGGVLGAAAGTALGLRALARDEVSIVTERREFTRPTLIGARYIPEDCTTKFDYDSDGNLTGSHQDCDSPYFQPILEERHTGLIEERQRFVHTQWLSPLSGALIGLGTGVLVGGLVGALVSSLAPKLEQPSPRGEDAPLAGAVVGTALGGLAGFYAGQQTAAHSQSITQIVRTPITERQRIGWVPHASDVRALGPQLDKSGQLFFDSQTYSGRVGIDKQVPTGEYRTTTQTSSSHGLTPFTGALAGMAIGAGAGALAGVAVGVLEKELAR